MTGTWWETLAQDVRYSARTLRRDARLTAFAILIVGLGIGASVTVFSVVNALLIRPLPFRDAERLVWISNGDSPDLSGQTTQVRYVQALQHESRTLEDVAGYSPFYGVGDHSLVSESAEPERLTRIEVTQNFFGMLGVRPAVGRLFTPEEVVFGGPKLMLMSHGLWRRRFASDRAIVGRAVVVDGEPVTVVGVLPESFDFGTIFAPRRHVDYFSPFPLSEETNKYGNTLALVGRLRGGATPAQVQSETTILAANTHRTAERLNGFHPLVRTLREHVSGAFKPALLVLIGAVALVMLMVCANLSNLLLTRIASRDREIATRVALGADRARLVRQLLTESVVLSAAGAVLGIVLAIFGTRALAHSQAVRLPLLDQVRVDGPALAISVAAAALTGILFGLAPALRATGLSIHELLKDAGRGTSSGVRQQVLRNGLVVAEVALACTLMVGAGLLTRSFLRVLDQDLGFHPGNAVAVRIDPSTKFSTVEGRIAYFDDALRRIRSAPGIESAGLTDVLPMGFNRLWSVNAPDQNVPPEQWPTVFVRVVSEGYLATMGVPIRQGRDFAASDDARGRPVIIIDESLARRLWPGQNPIGRMMNPNGNGGAREVIGVVRGLRYQAPEQEAGMDMYLPLRQSFDFPSVYAIVRGPLSSSALVSTARSALRPMDGRLPLTEVRGVQDIVDKAVSPRRFLVLILGGFAVFALVLASLGIYAVVSYGVLQRRREIGIRMALGATPTDVQLDVLARTLRLTAIGLAVGLLASWTLARLLQSLLFGVTFTDPTTFAIAVSALVAVAALAGYLPARRAALVNPADTLRTE
jgi:putative ABC transport system permease protein